MNVEQEILKHKHVIFGSDHYQTLGVVRSLGERGISADVILHPCYSKNPYLCSNSRYVGCVTIVETVEEGYDKLLKMYGNEQIKPFVYTCDDWAEGCLDAHYNDIINKFYFFNGAKQGIVSNYMDKEAIAKLAEKCGARIPKSETLYKGELPTTLNYPIITKSIMSTKGAWKGDSRICYSQEDLLENYKTIKSDVLLVEEYIVKKNELCLDGFSSNDGKDVCLPYQATYLRLSPSGYSNYMTIEPLKFESARSIVYKMLEYIGYNGIFSVEFLIGQNDELYFLEVNFRNSTWSYAYTVGGVNLPYEWAKATLLKKIDYSTMSFIKKPFKAIAEINDYIQFVTTGKISIFEWLRNVITAKCRFYMVFSDIKPIYVGLFRKLKRLL